MSPDKETTALLEAVEALCKAYCGPDAESEPWFETCKRLDRIDKLAKKLRRALQKQGGL
jgi:hypothetical protein